MRVEVSVLYYRSEEEAEAEAMLRSRQCLRRPTLLRRQTQPEKISGDYLPRTLSLND